MIDTEDSLAYENPLVSDRHDVTGVIFQRDFVGEWIKSIRSAFAALGEVTGVVHRRGALADEQSAITSEQILGAFTNRGKWILPSPNMLALKSEPTTVLDVTLSAGEELRVILTAPNAESDADHFVVLKAA